MSVTSTANKASVASALDSLVDRVHQLIKKLVVLYKEASKIDSTCEGIMGLMKGWVKTTNSSRKSIVEKFLQSMDALQDTVDVKTFKDKIAVFKHNEQLVISTCQQNLKALIDAIEADIAELSQGIVTKSKKLSQLKAEMEKTEPGKQIPASLGTDK